MMIGGVRRQSGFTILELLVTMTIMLVVLGGATEILMTSLRSQGTIKQTLDMNGQVRASIDLMQRDMLQVGQGLPVGRRVGIPNGVGALPIVRPGPAPDGICPGVDTFPDDSTLPAVTTGAGLGPAIGGTCTDVITVLAADSLFGPVPLAAIAADGRSAVIHDSVDISDTPDAGNDNLRRGDLLMITKGAMSVLMQITAVAGQVVTFGTGAVDPLGLNQFDTTLVMLGTVNQLKAQAPVDPDAPVEIAGVQQRGPSEATRIRMVTYYVDATTNPLVPRLARVLGGQPPNAVAIGVQDLRLTYDLVDLVDNPSAVRMDEDDLVGTGACDPAPCSENQIRKVNIVLSMNTDDARAPGAQRYGHHTQTTLSTQVSLRSMAFVDRYR